MRRFIYSNDKSYDEELINPLFKEKIAIVFCVDETYAPYLSVALESFKQNCKSLSYDIIILQTGLNEELKHIFIQNYTNEKIKIRFVNLEEKIANISKDILYTRVYLSVAMYYRFFIPELLKNYEKAIYCDCDVLFFDDIGSLFNLDLEGFLLGVVKDTESLGQHYKNSDFVGYCQNILKLKNSLNYFQSGVLVFNIKECLDKQLLQQCFDTLASINKPIYPDQDILNIVAESKVKFISQVYNVENHIVVFNRDGLHYLCEDDLKDYKNALKEVVILHYSGDRKPWVNLGSSNSTLWWFYARKSPFYEKILLSTYSNVITKQPIFGACNRVKNFLSYKLGKALLEAKNPIKLLFLPFTFLKIICNFKKEQKLYQTLIFFNPYFKKLPLEDYADYEEALKIKEHLSFKLGQELVKNPKSFVFNAFVIYRNFKRGC